MSKNKAIGIIGGMGPQASAYLYDTLIDLAIKDFKAKNNDDFPEIVLYSIPVPDFIANEKQRKTAREMLIQRVKKLNKLDLSCLSIACNTAHILQDDLQRASAVPFISMITEVCQEVAKNKIKKIGILGTPSTLNSNLYQAELEKYNIKSILPTKKNYGKIEKIIRNIINGTSSIKDEKELIKIADDLCQNGAEGIILGCTELPLVFPKQYKLPIYNSVEILARVLLRKYYKSNTISV